MSNSYNPGRRGALHGIACAAALLATACAAQVGEDTTDEGIGGGGVDVASVEGASAEGEQTKDPRAPSASLLSAEDRALLSEIGQRTRDLQLSQEQINNVTDPLSSIESTHEFFVATLDSLDDPETLDELSAEPGTSRSLYTPGATYPSTCNNKTVQYEIQIHTDAQENAGTDANVFLKWKGKFRTTTSNYSVPIQLDTPANDFEKGSLFDRTYSQVSHGDIVQYNLYHDNTGTYSQGGPGWFPNDVTFFDWCSRRVYTGPVNLWLATNIAPLYSTSFSSSSISESTF